MALILEVLDAGTGEVRTRVRIRLDALPLALGRGYGNDLILDDPYVDARHARISADASGALMVEDLGSVNGLLVQDAPERTGRLRIEPGMVIRVGRTLLRFRDPDEPVPEALPDVPAPAPPVPALQRWLSTRRARLGIPILALGAMAASIWLQSYERSSGSDAYAGALVFLVFGTAWAGIWAAASRIVVHRFHFQQHLAFASAAALAGLALTTAAEWAAFLFPESGLYGPLMATVSLGFIAALVAGHLVFASSLKRRRRWRAGIITSVILLALGGAAELVESETFSDVPEFSGILKPFRANWIPARSVESFGREVGRLKEEVDALNAEK